MSFADAPFSLLAHPYSSPVVGAVAYEMGKTNARNAIVFVGGLTDGPHSVPYIRTVARALEVCDDLDYSLFEIRIRSSFIGFGTSSLFNDVEDISSLVTYLRSIDREKVVLFGHSTGCQDCMEYTNYKRHPKNAPVDGFVLQAPVSDRDGIDKLFPTYQESLDLADKMIASGHSQDCLPQERAGPTLDAPVSAYRFKSLIGKHGDDDYFSSDLNDETVKLFWGRYNVPALVLHSEKDQYVPEGVNQTALNKKYQAANPFVSPLSCVVPGANHAVEEPEAQAFLSKRVVEFLRGLEK